MSQALGPDKPARVLEEQNELSVLQWRWLETEPAIKSIGPSIDGVCQQRPNPSMSSDSNCTNDSVLQQAITQTRLLIIQIHGEPRQNDQGNWVLPHTTTNPLGSFQRVNLADSQAIVASHPILIASDKGSRRSAPLGLTRILAQPCREGGLPAIKRLQPMRHTQRLRCRQTQVSAHTGRRESRSANF